MTKFAFYAAFTDVSLTEQLFPVEDFRSLAMKKSQTTDVAVMDNVL